MVYSAWVIQCSPEKARSVESIGRGGEHEYIFFYSLSLASASGLLFSLFSFISRGSWEKRRPRAVDSGGNPKIPQIVGAGADHGRSDHFGVAFFFGFALV